MHHHSLNTKLDGHDDADVDADAHANVKCKQSFTSKLLYFTKPRICYDNLQLFDVSFEVVLEKIAALEAENIELKTKISYLDGNSSGADITLASMK